MKNRDEGCKGRSEKKILEPQPKILTTSWDQPTNQHFFAITKRSGASYILELWQLALISSITLDLSTAAGCCVIRSTASSTACHRQYPADSAGCSTAIISRLYQEISVMISSTFHRQQDQTTRPGSSMWLGKLAVFVVTAFLRAMPFRMSVQHLSTNVWGCTELGLQWGWVIAPPRRMSLRCVFLGVCVFSFWVLFHFWALCETTNQYPSPQNTGQKPEFPRPVS